MMDIKINVEIGGLSELIMEQKRALKLLNELECSLKKINELKGQLKIQVD